MKQQPFQAAHEELWQQLQAWLDAREARARRGVAEPSLDDAAFPAAYRRVCQHYALAQRRGYSASLQQRLRDLVHRGHVQLYRAPRPAWRRMLAFVGAGFPRVVRQCRTEFWVSAVLFALPLLGTIALLQWRPELVHTLFDPARLVELERMYDPQAPHQAEGRGSGADLGMFGHYVMNNIGIGFRTFASGLLGAVGPVFVLVFNGVVIGAAAGHLTAIGHGETFWSFVAGHSAPELTAIVIAGAAGLRLGMALIAPGRRSRARALLEEGRTGAQLVLGVFAMLLFAAFIEAFWSSRSAVPDTVKYGVGAALWLGTALWLWRGGRGGEAGSP